MHSTQFRLFRSGVDNITLFIVMSGEDWNSIMYCTWDVDIMGGIFCLIWFFFSNFILLNMFSAIIIENFALTHMEKVQLQVLVYVNEKRKKFQKEELRKKMEALEKQSSDETSSWLEKSDKFVPDWECDNEEHEQKIMDEWELLQYTGLDEAEQQQYLDIVRLERDEAETMGLTEEDERLAEKSEAFEESLSGSSSVTARIDKAAKADQATAPGLTDTELKLKASKTAEITEIKVVRHSLTMLLLLTVLLLLSLPLTPHHLPCCDPCESVGSDLRGQTDGRQQGC